MVFLTLMNVVIYAFVANAKRTVLPNMSICIVCITDVREGRDALWEAHADGISAIKLDPSFAKAYYRYGSLIVVP